MQDANPATKREPAASLEARLRRFGVHRASCAAAPQTWSTGWPALDALLPGGGYPLSAVTEFLVEQPGSGELSLLLAALKPRLAAHDDSRLAFIDPPFRMHAPALEAAGIDLSRVPVIRARRTSQRIWSIEQLAAAGGFVGFVLWDSALDTSALRRLQLASEKAGCPVFVYRDLACARHRSPAALRLAIHSVNGRQLLEIVKCRGPAGARVAGLDAGQHSGWEWAAPDAPYTPGIITRSADNDTPGERAAAPVQTLRTSSFEATRSNSR